MNKKDFGKFYDEHLDKIYRFVFFRVGRNHELAQDLTSEIFVKALTHFYSYDPKISVSAWIYTIARNHLANYFRDVKSGVPLEEIENSLQFFHDGVSHMEKSDVAGRVRTALLKLAPEKRRMVEMKYLEGFSYAEIAEIVGGTEGSVKVASHRALKELHRFLAAP